MPSLKPYQEPHYVRLLAILQKWGAALDASDTGTGKTYVALFICRALGVVPLVVGPKTARAGWEDAARLVGVELEYINYERLRGRRRVRPEDQAAYDKAYAAYDAKLATYATTQDPAGVHLVPPKPPRPVAETEWLEEKPYGKGSFLRWKNSYALIIFDEVHRCGGPTSLNSKALIAAKRQAQYVLALSATAADDPCQMKALGYALGLHSLSRKDPPSRLNWLSWQMKHGIQDNWAGHMEFTTDPAKQRKAFEKIHHEVFPAHGARMRKSEIPGFPKTLIEVKLLTDDTGKAAKLSAKLHDLNAAAPGLGDTMSVRQKLEVLKVPHYVDLAQDYALTSKVVVFVNFTEPLFQLYDKLREVFGYTQVGYISGEQVGDKGYAERVRFLADFQANKLTALVCNVAAGGESANMHDPTGQVERTTLISPCESGRQFAQVTGRVNRDGGAFSQQFLAYFRDTHEALTADRLVKKNFNLALLNDGDFLC